MTLEEKLAAICQSIPPRWLADAVAIQARMRGTVLRASLDDIPHDLLDGEAYNIRDAKLVLRMAQTIWKHEQGID